MLKNFSVLQFSDGFKHIVAKEDVQNISKLRRLVAAHELFDCIREVHLNRGGHPASRKTHELCQLTFSNISRTMCEIFVELCTCRLDKKLPGRPDDI